MVMEEADTTDGLRPAANKSKGYHLKILWSIHQIIRAIDIDAWRLAAEHKVTGPQSHVRWWGRGRRHQGCRCGKHVHFNPNTLLCMGSPGEIGAGPARAEQSGSPLSPDHCYGLGPSHAVSDTDSSGVNARAVAQPVVAEGIRGVGSLDGTTGGPDGVARSGARPHRDDPTGGNVQR